ncbi:hypothetical protein SDJN03_27527, partial [Cucurbita argyrosperma subsp. sororia]
MPCGPTKMHREAEVYDGVESHCSLFEFEAGTRPRPTVIGPMGLKYIEHGPLYGPLLNEINGDCTGSAPSSSPFLRVVNCWLTSTVEEISIPRSILKEEIRNEVHHGVCREFGIKNYGGSKREGSQIPRAPVCGKGPMPKDEGDVELSSPSLRILDV